MIVMTQKQLETAFQLWVLDVRENPLNYQDTEEKSKRTVEEESRDLAHTLLAFAKHVPEKEDE